MSQNSKTIEDVLIWAKKLLKENGKETYSLDAQVLLMYVTGFSKVQLILNNKTLLEEEKMQEYEKIVKQRADGMPLQYITGKQEFMSLDFKVNSATLIPRGDTEILVEAVQKISRLENINNIMEIGTGSGCIPISLLYYNKEMKAVSFDISEEAIKIAEINSEINGVSDRITFIQSDLFEKASEDMIGKFDAIVSNPPYIPKDVIKNLMTEVKDFEPITALEGGIDGLYFYRAITEQGQKYIRSGGRIFYEIGCEQAEDVKKIMQLNGMYNIEVIKDLAGLDRVVIGQKR